MTVPPAPAHSSRPVDEPQPSDMAPPSDLPPAKLSENARIVLAKRYLKKDEAGTPTEDAETMFWRIARTVAEVDSEYGASERAVEEVARSFYDLMAQGSFEPNSPTLMNAGRPLGQLSACFVLPVEDALSNAGGRTPNSNRRTPNGGSGTPNGGNETSNGNRPSLNGGSGIYDTLRAMALVHQSGGGTGFSFSRLRPEGDTVRSTMGVASGPVSFMSLYDASTEVVKQGGTRRGANMGILRVDHPDVRKFVRCKNDTSQITNFNISVAVTDAFMEAVTEGAEYDLICPRTGEVKGRENAREVFDSIVEGAWKTGEPGVFFVDRANEHNPVPRLGAYEATNPCGEQPLLPYDVCNLGSINVGAFAKGGSSEARRFEDPLDGIDWDGLRHVVHLSVHFLDNVIDANRYPLAEIDDLAKKIRRVGLGIMGWADLLVRLGVRYDSEEGVETGRRVMAFVEEETRRASERLAEARGVFPAWEESIWGPDETCARDASGERVRPCRRLRNCNLTTVAPTGTISIIAGCSGGIEPLFAVAFMRNQAGSMMPDVNPDFVARARREGWYGDELMERIAHEGHIHFDDVPEDARDVFRTSHDISPEWHVRMQAAFQEHVDSAISKTTNFAHEATREDVREIYDLAFRLGCKGVTVYRDGSRPMQVLSTGKTGRSEEGAGEAAAADALGAGSAKAVEALEQQLADAREEAHCTAVELAEARRQLEALDRKAAATRQVRTRPQMLRGRTTKMKSPLGDLYVTINEDDKGYPFEVFCTLGKAGGAAMADLEAVGRLASLALRSGVLITAVRDQLRGISCDRAVGVGQHKVLSAPDAVAQAIDHYLAEKSGVQEELPLGTPAAAAVAEVDATGGAPSSTAPLAFTATGYVDHTDAALGSCPACGASQLAYEEGCRKCYVCGFSECG